MIKTEQLTKYYKNHARGIENLSLKIGEGEVFGFIGPNGAGKSTTVRTLLNLIFPSSGEGTVMGFDIVKDTVDIRKHIGYVPSEVNYYGDMIVKHFLDYALTFHQGDYHKRLAYLVEKFEIDLEKKVGDLSYGNKKKVAIVIALAHQPKLVILDEPTSGLDPLMQSVLFEILNEEKKRGTTIFFSSHVLSDVQKICDRVGIIKEGHLIKIESIEDILKTQAKNVRLIAKEIVLEENEHLVNLKKVKDTYYFTYKGDINLLLKKLQTYQIQDISITEPTLEEIFMHYYTREDAA